MEPDSSAQSSSKHPPRRQRPKGDQNYRNARQQCTDAYREDKNKEILAKRFIDEGVRTGFIDRPQPRKAIEKPPAPELSNVVPTGFPEIGLDTTTRLVPFSPFGISLMVNDFYVRFRESFGAECTIHQFYRFTLAQLEYQIFVAHQTAVSPFPFCNPRTVFDEPFQRVLKGYPENFRAIVAAIECYGHFTLDEAKFCSELPPDAVFSPYAIRLGNLRAALNVLEQGNNPGFVARNPSPGAVFQEGILINGADICPLDYDAQDLELDAEAVRAGFDAMKIKYSSFIGMCSYNGVGKPATLVTVDVTRPAD